MNSPRAATTASDFAAHAIYNALFMITLSTEGEMMHKRTQQTHNTYVIAAFALLILLQGCAAGTPIGAVPPEQEIIHVTRMLSCRSALDCQRANPPVACASNAESTCRIMSNGVGVCEFVASKAPGTNCPCHEREMRLCYVYGVLSKTIPIGVGYQRCFASSDTSSQWETKCNSIPPMPAGAAGSSGVTGSAGAL